MPRISLQKILDQVGPELQLDPANNTADTDPLLTDEGDQFADPERLAGPMSCVRPSLIQVLGTEEIRYLQHLQQATRNELMSQLTDTVSRLVVIADDCEPPAQLAARCDQAGIPMLRSPLPSSQVINRLSRLLHERLRQRSIIHGVFMEVIGIGVLLTGSSGIGKSELALELLTRGHRLIADDAPEFTRVNSDTVSGSCPAAIRDFIEVRGLGILNVRSMFGDSAIKREKYLRLIVELQQEDELARPLERVENHTTTRLVEGVEIPLVTVPVAPGRNIAVIVETAARNRILLNKGYNAAEAFRRQQRSIMEKGE